MIGPGMATTRSSPGSGRPSPRTRPSRSGALRRENLAGLSGRVAGGRRGHRDQLRASTRHRDRGGRDRARAPAAGRATRRGRGAPVPVTVSDRTVEEYSADRALRRGGVLAGAVLGGATRRCSAPLFALLKPGGELRYFEHVASGGARGGLQRLADATIWPRLFGNCHTHRDTEQIDHRRRLRGPDASRRGQPVPGVGAGAGVRSSRSAGAAARPERSAQQGGQPLQQPGRACRRGRRAGRPWRSSDSGVGSGLTSMTVVPCASASSGRPAAG